MSSLAVLLTADTFGWPSQLPGANGGVLQALLISTTLLQFIGPLLAERAVRDLAQECPPISNTKVP